MDYRLKAIIGGVELLETADLIQDPEREVEYNEPSISAVTLLDNATTGVMTIGATPSDQLTFTINNPNRQNYDGEAVELWIAPPDDDTEEMEEQTEIEDEVGEADDDEVIDEDEDGDEYDDEDSEGDDLTPEEEADIAEASAEETEARYITFEGEDEPVTTETTDEGEEPEWRRVGIFYVDSQKNSDDGKSIVLTCYDSMQRLNKKFTPTTSTGSIQDLYDDLCDQALTEIGVSIDDFDFGNEGDRVVTWPGSASYRDALGWFAGLIGAFATCGDDGSVGFSMYAALDGIYLDTALTSLSTDLSGEVEIDGIRCYTGMVTSDYLDTGFDPDISFRDPLINQDQLDAILTEYKGVHFEGGRLCMDWDDSIMAGSFIRIMTSDEYANYLGLKNTLSEGGLTEAEILELQNMINSLGRVFLISSQVIDFTGEATTTIKSITSSRTAQENTMTPPTQAYIGRVSDVAVEAHRIADSTRQYFWFEEIGTDTGAHISETPQSEWDDPNSEHYQSGGNLLARSNGIAIRDGLRELAIFGDDEARIGAADDNHISITSTEFKGTNENVDFMSFSTNGALEETWGTIASAEGLDLSNTHSFLVPEILGDNVIISVGFNILDSDNTYAKIENIEKSDDTFLATAVPNGIGIRGGGGLTGIYFLYSLRIEDRFVLETSGSAFSKSYSVTFDATYYNAVTDQEIVRSVTEEWTCSYDPETRELSFSPYYPGAGLLSINIMNRVVSQSPSFVLGTSITTPGSYSAAVGKSLDAAGNYQLVAGKYNARTDDMFVIGNGTAEDDRQNIFTVSPEGHATASGHMFEYIEEIDDPVIFSSITTGDVVSSHLALWGTRAFLSVTVRATEDSTAEGEDIFLGVIKEQYRPKRSTTTGSFYGQHAVNGLINASNGLLYVRNASSSALTVRGSNSVTLSFSYQLKIAPTGSGGGSGGGGGQTSGDYDDLLNKPSIEGVTLIGDKTYEELNLQKVTNSEINDIMSGAYLNNG